MKAFVNGFKSTEEHNATSVSFTDIASGIFGFPKNIFFESVIKSMEEYMKENPSTKIKEVKFVHSNPDAVKKKNNFSAKPFLTFLRRNKTSKQQNLNLKPNNLYLSRLIFPE